MPRLSNQTEEAHKEAESRYRTLVEQIPIVTYIDRADDSDTSVYTSPQIEKLLGYNPEEWRVDKLWAKCLHPEDEARILRADERFSDGACARVTPSPASGAMSSRSCWK